VGSAGALVVGVWGSLAAEDEDEDEEEEELMETDEEELMETVSAGGCCSSVGLAVAGFMKGSRGLKVALWAPKRLGLSWLAAAWGAPVVLLEAALWRARAAKLDPNRARLAEMGELGVALASWMGAASVVGPVAAGTAACSGLPFVFVFVFVDEDEDELEDEEEVWPLSRRRPANSCLLDLRVLVVEGRRVVVVELLVGVELAGPAGELAKAALPAGLGAAGCLVALRRVWKRLLRLPNLRRVAELELSELGGRSDSAVGSAGAVAGALLLVGGGLGSGLVRALTEAGELGLVLEGLVAAAEVAAEVEGEL